MQGQIKHQSMSFRGLYNERGNFKSFKTLPVWLMADCQCLACSTPGLKLWSVWQGLGGRWQDMRPYSSASAQV